MPFVKDPAKKGAIWWVDPKSKHDYAIIRFYRRTGLVYRRIIARGPEVAHARLLKTFQKTHLADGQCLIFSYRGDRLAVKGDDRLVDEWAASRKGANDGMNPYSVFMPHELGKGY